MRIKEDAFTARLKARPDTNPETQFIFILSCPTDKILQAATLYCFGNGRGVASPSTRPIAHLMPSTYIC